LDFVPPSPFDFELDEEPASEPALVVPLVLVSLDLPEPDEPASDEPASDEPELEAAVAAPELVLRLSFL
jgi:hypothetical protein